MLPPRVTVFDFEMPNSLGTSVSAVGLTVLVNGKAEHEFYSLVDPESGFDPFTVELTGIRPEDVEGKPNFPALWETLRPDFENTVLCAHAAAGDLHVLSNTLKRYGIPWEKQVPYLCTLELAKAAEPERARYSLDVLAKDHGVSLSHHVASSDAEAAAELLLLYDGMLENTAAHLRLFDMEKGHPDRPTGKDRMVENVRRYLRAKRSDEVYAAYLAAGDLNENELVGVSDEVIRDYAERLVRRSGIQLFLDDLPHAWFEEDLLHAEIINLKRNPVSVVSALDAFLPHVKNEAVFSALHPAALDNRRELLRRCLPRWLDESGYAAAFAVKLCTRFFGMAKQTEVGIVRRVWDAQFSNGPAAPYAREYFSRLQRKAPERFDELKALFAGEEEEKKNEVPTA